MYSVNICIADANGLQDMIREQGAIISSNGRSQIAVREVADHLTIPDYPETTRDGILHFIHSRNPIEATDESSIRKTFIKQASNVSSAYPGWMQN